MHEITKGSKYAETRDLDIAEIAKRIRKDLKAAQVAGELPLDATFAVRIDRFSGGQSLDVTLSGMPDSWTYNQPGLEPNYAEYIPAHGGQTDQATAVERKIKGLVFAYNYDGSDIQSDYFNERFYSNVSIRDEQWQRFADAEKARKAQQKAARA